MSQLFIILAIIVAVLLVLIVLMQNSKGGGLSSQFGGGGAQQVIGVKKTTDILEKATWVLIVVLIALCLTSSLTLEKGNTNFVNPNVDAAQQSQQPPGLPPVTTDTTGTDMGGLGTMPTDTTGEQ